MPSKTVTYSYSVTFQQGGSRKVTTTRARAWVEQRLTEVAAKIHEFDGLPLNSYGMDMVNELTAERDAITQALAYVPTPEILRVVEAAKHARNKS